MPLTRHSKMAVPSSEMVTFLGIPPGSQDGVSASKQTLGENYFLFMRLKSGMAAKLKKSKQ